MLTYLLSLWASERQNFLSFIYLFLNYKALVHELVYDT